MDNFLLEKKTTNILGTWIEPTLNVNDSDSKLYRKHYIDLTYGYLIVLFVII